MKKEISQSSIYLIYAGATAFFFSLVFTVSQVYRIEVLRLDALQLVLIGTVLELSCFIFEIPTGIVADMKSRKLSVLIGLFMIGAAFILEGAIPIFMAVMVSQVLWGIGYTFTSGADDAWIADEVSNTELDSLYLKSAQIAQVFSLLGIIISTTIGSKIINMPMIIGGALFILLAIFLSLFMRETNFKPAPREDRDSWRQMVYTFSQGVKFIKGKSILKLMLIMSLLYGLYSEGFDRLWTAHFIENIGFPNLIELTPIVWIGIVDGIAMIFSILAVEYIKRRLAKTGELQGMWLLVIINILMVATIIFFGLSGNFIMGFSMYMCFYILRTANGPLFRSWKNRNIKSEFRATVLSTYGQIDALGQIIGGPIIGFIAVRTSIATAIVASGIILSPIILLSFYGLRKREETSDFTIENQLSEH